MTHIKTDFKRNHKSFLQLPVPLEVLACRKLGNFVSLLSLIFQTGLVLACFAVDFYNMFVFTGLQGYHMFCSGC